MAASLAHEIRNPLGAMKGLTQLAQEDLPPDHRTQDLMKTVVTEAERLEKLVSDLLSFARPRKPQISDFDLGQLVFEVREMLRLQAEERRISLMVEPSAGSLPIRSDPDGLRQVLLNILLNALHASPEEGRVTLAARRDGVSGQVLIEVSDNGPGLQGTEPEELFQPFTTTKAQGTGLGLAISRRIVTSLGGTISLTDREGGGARCTIRLGDMSAILPSSAGGLDQADSGQRGRRRP
jgi:two-component system sensor histidine kinase HydH